MPCHVFQMEKRYLLRGERFSWSPFPSVILQCADRHLGRFFEDVIGMLFVQHGGEFLRLGQFIEGGSGGVPKVPGPEWWRENLESQGYFYGAIEPLDDALIGRELRHVLLVRDPRDVLVSEYLRVQGKGLGPGGRSGGGKLRSDPDRDLEDYVLDVRNSSRLERRYLAMISCAGKCDAWVHREEDAGRAPKEFMHDILLFLTGHESPIVLDRIYEHLFLNSGFDEEGSEREGPSSWGWGYFRELLSPEAQACLWDRLGSVARSFGYEESSLGTLSFESNDKLVRIS